MDNEDLIREQMENTRTSLTEKLETLENKVTSTVDNATANVADTVEAVKDTVQETVANMKDTVQDTISAVKDGVQESVDAVTDSVRGGVDAVKDVFDIPGHVQSYPWAMFGGSVALGFCLGNYLASKHEAIPKQKHKNQSKSHSSRFNGNGHHQSQESASKAAGFLQTFAPEIEKLKGLAIGALMGTVRDMIVPAVPENYSESLTEIINDVTDKLGGTSFRDEKIGDHGYQAKQETCKDEPNILGSRWARAN